MRDTVVAEDVRDAYEGVFSVQDVPAEQISAVESSLTRMLEELLL